MRLLLGNLRCRVEATEDEAAWLFEYLSFEDNRLKFLRRKYHIQDDRIRMFNRMTSSFPAGLASMAHRAAVEAELQVVVEDRRSIPCPPRPDADLAWLRDYQMEGVRRSMRAVRGLIWLPTASGKTEIACGLVESLPCRWLFLVHRSLLMHQTAERFTKRTGEPAGKVGDEEWSEDRFTVATFQTLAKALKKGNPRARVLLDSIEGLIVDEAHVLPADSFWKVAMSTPNAYWRIGMSGTPLARGDRRSVLAISALGPVIMRVKPQTLIDRGLLAAPRIRMVLSQADSDAVTPSGVYGEAVIRSTGRNRALAVIAKHARKPALLFVKSIKHGKLLLERLEKAGVKAEFVWGSSATPKRQAAVRRLEHGDTDVLICSVIFQEGIDIPTVQSVIVGASGRSTIAALQRIGRGMRLPEGKSPVLDVWDIFDVGNRMLERHARIRCKAYEREGYKVERIDPTKDAQQPTARPL